MVIKPKERNIAYRCPECGTATIGLVGKFALGAGMIRLRCDCEEGGSSLDIKARDDGKVRLSVPCIFCKQNHSYTVTESIFFDKDKFLLSCPYSGMDIAVLGSSEDIQKELARTGEELERLMAGLEAEELSDIQPTDMTEDEILPDPAVYDTVRFIVKTLEDEDALHCPCGEGPYDLRFADGGIQVYCEHCGATHLIQATSPAVAEEYLTIDELRLT